MQKSFSLQYKNIAMYIFCWLMPYNIRRSNVWILKFPTPSYQLFE